MQVVEMDVRAWSELVAVLFLALRAV